MRILLDDKSAEFAELRIKEGLDDHTITIDCLFMKLQEHFERNIDSFLESPNLVFLNIFACGILILC